MKFRRGLLLLCLTLSLPLAAPARAALPAVEADRIVAVVNDEAVTARELQARVNTVVRQLKQQGTDLPDTEALNKQVLERLIMERAQLQLAKEDGIVVDDGQLNAALLRIAEANHLDGAQFRAALEKDGISWVEFQENIRKEIALGQVREKEVDNRIAVSDGEIDNYLATSADQNGEEFLIQHILVRAPEQATPEQLQRLYLKAQMVMEKLGTGMSFAKAAATYSDGNEALNGGTVGWRTANRIPSVFAKPLEHMRPGEISPILRSPAGFHILRLADRRGAGALPKQMQQTHVRHILIKTNELVSEAEARHKLEVLRDRLVHGGDFAELARLNSNDLSASKGGDIGWVLPGDTVPEFQHAMDALKPGEISQPVQSSFGFHLIQVLERKVEDLSPERRRAAARQVLRERKADEFYQDWLRQLRDRTYVEYHLEDK
jgi:peptidyl-prolyl cis-trans isomerase SurA